MEKQNLTPVLAQCGVKIGLALLPSSMPLRRGNTFDREPAKYGPGKWTIIKIYDGVNGQRIRGIISLVGLEAAEELFAVEVWGGNEK